jgi:NitT/TauT family transport system ATP-binding protein
MASADDRLVNMNPLLVSIQGLGKIYERKRADPIEALADITFDVNEGEIVSIIGPSGCGKSTLLKIIAGILPKSTGKMHLDGEEITGPSKSMSMVFQSPVLFPWRTVRSNILLPVTVRGLATSDYVNKADELLSLVDLDGFGDRLPKELSGGMQQRAALCRSLILEPRVLLMDEPFGALDALTRERMAVELLRLWERTQTTIFFVTHSIIEAVFISHRVILLSNRPAIVDRIFDVNFPFPRDLLVMSSPEFAELTGQIRIRLGITQAD